MKLGSPVRDIITGFEGVVWARAEYLTGCNQIAVKSTKLDKDGNIQDATWMDENRIEVLGAPSAEIEVLLQKTRPDLGGPQETPTGRSD